MIERYTREKMGKIWSDRNRYLQWLRVEAAVCEALARTKRIPARDWAELKRLIAKLERKGGVHPARVDHFEAVTRHDVIAFTTAVAEEIGPLSRYIHFGLTSSDVVDTSLSLLVQEAGALLIRDVEELLSVLRRLALKYKKLPTIGRSHGIFAEPTSFGLKFLGWFSELSRGLGRLRLALENMRYGKLSGAVGVSAHWEPAFEAKVLASLGLRREPVSTQVIPRDRHADFMSALAICAAAIERIAVELRHLQRSEVGEVLEGFRKGQKGSSAMPHKRNPISSENLTGCARLMRSYAQASMENIALWHERDISHSSVERVAFPDATILLDYMLGRMLEVLSRLDIRRSSIKANLERAGDSVYSGHFLLALVQAGATREDAYSWIQECAIQAVDEGSSFIAKARIHPEILKFLKHDRIRKLGSPSHQLRNVDAIYREVLSK